MSAVADGLDIGRETRRRVPRSAHAQWTPPADRPEVAEFLRELDRGRLAELLPLRYARMAASPFAFFRGSAGLMARDLASTPTTGWHIQADGDAHVANFGAFATPERNLVFDLNDFDETLPGPWEWDLKRLAASLILLGRAHNISAAASERAVRAMARSYRLAVRGYARSGYLSVFYAQLDAARVMGAISTLDRPAARHAFRQAEQHDQLGALAKLATIENGRPRIIDRPPLVTHSPEDEVLSDPETLVRTYRASLRTDVQRKAIGIGAGAYAAFDRPARCSPSVPFPMPALDQNP